MRTNLRHSLLPHPVWWAIWPIALVTLPIGLPTAGFYLYAHHHDIAPRRLCVYVAALLATLAVLAGLDTNRDDFTTFGRDLIDAATVLATCLFWGALLAAAILWVRNRVTPADQVTSPSSPTAHLPAASPVVVSEAKELIATAVAPVVDRARTARQQGRELVSGFFDAVAPRTVVEAPPTPESGEGRQGIHLGTDTTTGGQAGVFVDELQSHTLLLGATGSGKTTSLLAILEGAVAHGLPVVAIDLKGSPSFRDRLRQIANSAGRRMRCWSIDGGTHWNPLAHGEPTELKDKLIGLEAWSEPHYQRSAERYLQNLFAVLRDRGEQPTLDRVVDLLNPAALNAQLRDVTPQLADRVAAHLDQITNSHDQISAIGGLANRLAVIAHSDAGPFITTNDQGGETIDLANTITAGDICLFSLDSLRYGELARHIAGLAIQDLKTVAGDMLATGNQQALAAIDEFSALDSDQLLSLLARAREAGIGVILSTQDLADLTKIDPAFADQVLANTNIKLVHRQEIPDTAELLAGTIGTHKAWETTEAEHDTIAQLFTGAIPTVTGSRRLVDKYTIHPNILKILATGQALLSIKAPNQTAGIVDIQPYAAASFAPLDRNLAPPPDQPTPPHPTPGLLDIANHLLGRTTERT